MKPDMRLVRRPSARLPGCVDGHPCRSRCVSTRNVSRETRLSTAAYPNLTAIGRDVVDTGKQAAELLLKLIDGERVGHLMEGPCELRARASTGPAPAGE